MTTTPDHTESPVVVTLAVSFKFAVLQEHVGLELARTVKGLVDEHVPEIIEYAVEVCDDPSAAIDVWNDLSVGRPLEADQ